MILIPPEQHMDMSDSLRGQEHNAHQPIILLDLSGPWIALHCGSNDP